MEIIFPKVKKRKLEIKTIRFDKKNHPQLSVELFESDGISSNYVFGLKEVSNNDSIYEMDARKFNTDTNLWEEINPSNLSLNTSYQSYNSIPNYINEIENYDSFVNELFNVNQLVVWENQGKGKFKNENGKIVVFDDNDPKWKIFLQAYNVGFLGILPLEHLIGCHKHLLMQEVMNFIFIGVMVQVEL